MARRIRERHLPAVDRALGDVGPDVFWHLVRLLEFLCALSSGVTELMCHPGALNEPVGYRRADELGALCDPVVREALQARGAVLVAAA